jgi:hypothetical protein
MGSSAGTSSDRKCNNTEYIFLQVVLEQVSQERNYSNLDSSGVWGRESTSGDASCFFLPMRRVNKGGVIPWNEACAKEKVLYGHV